MTAIKQVPERTKLLLAMVAITLVLAVALTVFLDRSDDLHDTATPIESEVPLIDSGDSDDLSPDVTIGDNPYKLVIPPLDVELEVNIPIKTTSL